jgi:hypothetical protein
MDTIRPARPAASSRRRETGIVGVVFAGVTVLMTWPQTAHLLTGGRQHQDVYFNLWRLRWIAHALIAFPGRFFDGNIFYPERRTLTLSDAMPVEGLIGAPLLWAGLPPVLVHNLLLLGAIAGSGVAMFVFVRRLTRSAAAGVLAGIVFAFVPYRFEHYMHLELQWAMWTPLAFWALHRTFESGAIRDGVATGAFVALQMLSSIYYGIFLATLLALVAVLLLLADVRRAKRPLAALAVGGLLAIVVCGAYSVPYLQTKAATGGRGPDDVVRFSARPSSYLVATPDNVLWGRAFASRGRMERRLFLGATPVFLAMMGLLLTRPDRIALAYAAAVLAAFDMSLGLSGHIYPFLYAHVPVFQGLRAVARLGIFVAFFVAALAARGYVVMTAEWRPRSKRLFAAGLAVALLAEYRIRPMQLIAYPNDAPPLYAWLARQPQGVVAELPFPPEGQPGSDPLYTYMSTFHWQPIVNGYSGVYPQSYIDRLAPLRTFPSDAAIARLRGDNVRYVVLHLIDYDARIRDEIVASAKSRYGLPELVRLPDGRGEAVVLGIR